MEKVPTSGETKQRTTFPDKVLKNLCSKNNLDLDKILPNERAESYRCATFELEEQIVMEDSKKLLDALKKIPSKFTRVEIVALIVITEAIKSRKNKGSVSNGPADTYRIDVLEKVSERFSELE